MPGHLENLPVLIDSPVGNDAGPGQIGEDKAPLKIPFTLWRDQRLDRRQEVEKRRPFPDDGILPIDLRSIDPPQAGQTGVQIVRVIGKTAIRIREVQSPDTNRMTRQTGPDDRFTIAAHSNSVPLSIFSITG